MDTEKKPGESSVGKPNQDVGQIVGELVISGATVLANTAAQAVVDRVRKAAVKSRPGEAAAKVMKKAKKSAASKAVKNKQASKKAGAKSARKKAK
jgi:hypothetical protein